MFHYYAGITSMYTDKNYSIMCAVHLDAIKFKSCSTQRAKNKKLNKKFFFGMKNKFFYSFFLLVHGFIHEQSEKSLSTLIKQMNAIEKRAAMYSNYMNTTFIDLINVG